MGFGLSHLTERFRLTVLLTHPTLGFNVSRPTKGSGLTVLAFPAVVLTVLAVLAVLLICPTWRFELTRLGRFKLYTMLSAHGLY